MLASALLLLASADAGHASFAGPTIGLEGGRQNVVAGAQVGGVDVLRQEGKAVFSIVGGYRFALGERGIAGVEAGYGWIDGDLARAAPGASIEYQPKQQYHYGAMAGWVADLGGATLLFGYLNETKRTFQVSVQQGAERFGQRDEQGIVRYGLGIERALWRGVLGRITAGSTHARFPGRSVLQGERVVELMAGLAWNFR